MKVGIAAAAIFALACAGAWAEPPGLEAGLEAGTDGVAAACWADGVWKKLDLGARAGVGYEWTDFRLNDPVAALKARWRIAQGPRWAWTAGVETGVILLDTGYDRLALPFIGATTGAVCRIGPHLAFSAEAGGRYGRRTRETHANLDFLDVRYRETLSAPALILRLGASWRF